jgi:hypothetical protein
MNATMSGINLADLTVRVALGEEEASSIPRHGQPGIRNHSLLAILLGVVGQGASRWKVLHTIVEAMRGRGIFAQSREDLTPVRLDPLSLIPLGVVTGQLLLRPRAAYHIASGAVSAYSLTAATVETIKALDVK